MPVDLNIAIHDDEYKDIVDLVYRWSGINLGEHKKDLVKARLFKRIRHGNFRTFREYYGFVIDASHREELIELLNAISTNVTSFFREVKHFEILKERVLPELVERKNKDKTRKIRIWSAACATGEEVYSLLICVLEFLKDPTIWDIKILGTDISTRALVAAKAGIYGEEKIKAVDPALLRRYFDVLIDRGQTYYRIKDFLRGMVIFGRLNLMDDIFPFSSHPNIVFCRNVMIYFDKETQGRLIKKIHYCLEEEGYLFTGHSESLMGIDVVFKNIAPAVYKKVVIS